MGAGGAGKSASQFSNVGFCLSKLWTTQKGLYLSIDTLEIGGRGVKYHIFQLNIGIL